MLKPNVSNRAHAALDATSRHIGDSPRLVLRRLLPTFLTLVCLLLAGAGALLWQQYRQGQEEAIASDRADLAADFRLILDQQENELSLKAQSLIVDPAVRNALREHDVDSLLASWRPAFETMRREDHVTHLYFLDRNRVCLLRVHDPDQRGDRIDRFTALEAERTGKLAVGVELGMKGTYTLRAVQPVVVDGALVGYVEVGKEIESVLQTLLQRVPFWTQLTAVVRKELLQRQEWEGGMRMLGRQADWDRFPRLAIIYASQAKPAAAFVSWIDSAGGSNRGDPGAVVADQGKYWRIVDAPMQDAAGTEVGSLLALHDVTDERAALVRLLVLGGVTGSLLLILMLLFVYILLRRTDDIVNIQQAELRERHWKLGNVLDGTRAGTWEWNVQTGETVINERWAEILGRAHADLAPLNHRTWEELVHPEDLSQVNEQLRSHFAREQLFFDHIYRMRHKDGRWIWIHDRGRLFTRTGTGEPLLMFGTSTDITARKEAEAEHSQLQKAKMARELGEMMHANRLVALGTLMAGLAHEFNHPAQVVLLNQRSLRTMVEACAEAARHLQGSAVGLLTWEEVATIAPALLDDLELATAHLHELIENVQNYARPSEGLCDTADTSALPAVSASSVRLVAAYARRCQVALVSDIQDDGEDGPIGCSCLQQVVVNLLINAVQASPVGGTVRITCRLIDGSMCLSISDEGPGIDPTVVARLGQPFTTTKASSGGSGLGLFITLHLVTDQGGTLELTPNHPRGTVAKVMFHSPGPV